MWCHLYGFLENLKPLGQKTGRWLGTWGEKKGTDYKGQREGKWVIVTQLYTFVKMHRTEHQNRSNFTICKLLLDKRDTSSSLWVARLFSEQRRKGHEKLRQLCHWLPRNVPGCPPSKDAEVSTDSHGALIQPHHLWGKAFTTIPPKHWVTILSFPTGYRDFKYERDLN